MGNQYTQGSGDVSLEFDGLKIYGDTNTNLFFIVLLFWKNSLGLDGFLPLSFRNLLAYHQRLLQN